jgi:urease accessory protein
MASDAVQRRGDLPVVFTSLTGDDGVRPIADWVLERLTVWRHGTARPEPAVAAH